MSAFELWQLLHGRFDRPHLISEYYFYVPASKEVILISAENEIRKHIYAIEGLENVDLNAVYNKGSFKKTTSSLDPNVKYLMVLKVDKVEELIPAYEDEFSNETELEHESESVMERVEEKRSSGNIESVEIGVTDPIKIEPKDQFLPRFNDKEELDHECTFDPEILQRLQEDLGKRGDKKLQIDRQNVIESIIEEYKKVSEEESHEESFQFHFKSEEGLDYGGVRKEVSSVTVEAAIAGRVLSDPDPSGSCIIPIPKNIEAIEAIFFFMAKLTMAGVLIPLLNPLTLACIIEEKIPTSNVMWADALQKFPAACGKNAINDMRFVLHSKISSDAQDDRLMNVRMQLNELGDMEPLTEDNKVFKIGELFKNEMLINQIGILTAARNGVKKAGFNTVLNEHPAIAQAWSSEVRPFLIATKEELVSKIGNGSLEILGYAESQARDFLIAVLEELSQEGGALHEMSEMKFEIRNFVKYITGGYDLLSCSRILLFFTEDIYQYFATAICSPTITLPTNLNYQHFKEELFRKMAWGDDGFTFA